MCVRLCVLLAGHKSLLTGKKPCPRPRGTPRALTQSRGILVGWVGVGRGRRGQFHVSMRSRSATSLVKHHRSPQWNFTAHAVYTVTAITHSASCATAWAPTHLHTYTPSQAGRWLIVTVVGKLLTALSVKGQDRSCKFRHTILKCSSINLNLSFSNKTDGSRPGNTVAFNSNCNQEVTFNFCLCVTN